MNTYKVTQYIKELSLTVSHIVETELTADEYKKLANKAPEGIKRPLAKTISVTTA